MKPVRVIQNVAIPDRTGTKIIDWAPVEVEALKDAETGETYLDGAALELMDKVKARATGRLTPSQTNRLVKFVCNVSGYFDDLADAGHEFTEEENNLFEESLAIKKDWKQN